MGRGGAGAGGGGGRGTSRGGKGGLLWGTWGVRRGILSGRGGGARIGRRILWWWRRPPAKSKPRPGDAPARPRTRGIRNWASTLPQASAPPSRARRSGQAHTLFAFARKRRVRPGASGAVRLAPPAEMTAAGLLGHACPNRPSLSRNQFRGSQPSGAPGLSPPAHRAHAPPAPPQLSPRQSQARTRVESDHAPRLGPPPAFSI